MDEKPALQVRVPKKAKGTVEDERLDICWFNQILVFIDRRTMKEVKILNGRGPTGNVAR